MATITPPLAPAPIRPEERIIVPPKGRVRRFLDGIYPYGYIGPSIVFMAIASFFPIIFTIYIALTNYSSTFHLLNYQFVGLQQFANIANQVGVDVFLQVFVWNIIFAAVVTLLSFSGGLLLALLLNNENMRERNLYRTILIIPWALPATITILAVANGLFVVPFGLMSQVFADLHIPAVFFLGDIYHGALWPRLVVLVLGFYLGYPFMMTACLGALQSISPEVLQAAEIDGANGIQKFFQVTLPLLRSATLPLTISTFAFNFNNFGLIFLSTGGGPPINSYAGQTDILASMIYKMVIGLGDFGLAAACSVLLFFIIAPISAVNMKLTGAFAEIDR
jgi:arabinogalactan oligomer / maltooligosaccharide transport system permease protein